MRKKKKNALVVGVTDSGIISSVLSYDIKMNVEEGSLEDWLIAFAATISQIPKKIRKKITVSVDSFTSKNFFIAFNISCNVA